MLAGTIGNAISPGLVGLINKHGSEEEWRYIWIMTAGVNFVAAIVYFIFGSAEIQEWAKPKAIPPPEKVDPSEIEGQSRKPGLDRRISEVSSNDYN